MKRSDLFTGFSFKKLTAGILAVVILCASFTFFSYGSLKEKDDRAKSLMNDLDRVTGEKVDLLLSMTDDAREKSSDADMLAGELLRGVATMENLSSPDEKADIDFKISEKIHEYAAECSFTEDFSINSQEDYKGFIDAESKAAEIRKEYNKTVAEYNNQLDTFRGRFIMKVAGLEPYKLLAVPMLGE